LLVTSDWLSIIWDTLQALWRACQVRLLGKSTAGCLPPVSEDHSIQGSTRDRIARFVNLMVLCLLFFKPGKCYYRCYAISFVLRKRGVPIFLNLGCTNYLELNSKASGHCWLTIKGELYLEKTDPYTRYTHFIGCSGNQVNFWMGPYTKSIERKKVVANDGS
jgi:hypothetical protein